MSNWFSILFCYGNKAKLRFNIIEIEFLSDSVISIVSFVKYKINSTYLCFFLIITLWSSNWVSFIRNKHPYFSFPHEGIYVRNYFSCKCKRIHWLLRMFLQTSSSLWKVKENTCNARFQVKFVITSISGIHWGAFRLKTSECEIILKTSKFNCLNQIFFV